MDRPNIFVVGSLNADLVQNVARFPGAAETLIGGEVRTFAGGKGGNQAVAAARMGGRVSMIGQVGKDGFATLTPEETSARLAALPPGSLHSASWRFPSKPWKRPWHWGNSGKPSRSSIRLRLIRTAAVFCTTWIS